MGIGYRLFFLEVCILKVQACNVDGMDIHIEYDR